MATRFLVFWILIITLLLNLLVGYVDRHYSDQMFEVYKTKKLASELKRQERVIAKLGLQHQEYLDSVAKLGIKIDEKTNWFDPKRNIASVASALSTKKVLELNSGRALLNQGIKFFEKENYKTASGNLERYLAEFPLSLETPKVLYLLGESYFQQGEIQKSLKSFNQLVTHFPETEYTAFGLLRVAKVMNDRERVDEAHDVYTAIIKNFPESEAARVAKQKIHETEY